MKTPFQLLAWYLAISPIKTLADMNMAYWCGPNIGCGGASQDLSTVAPTATHLMVSFGTILADGTPAYQDYSANNNDEALNAFNGTTILSIGGAAGDFSPALKNPQNFADGCKVLMEQYSWIQGFDLDLEPILQIEQVDDFIALVRVLRSTIGSTPFLSIAPECVGVFASDNYNPDYYNTYRKVVEAVVIPYNVYINVQDYNNPYCSPNGYKEGTADYYQDIAHSWIEPYYFSDGTYYPGMPAEKFTTLVLAGNSTDYDGSSGYGEPPEVEGGISKIRAKYGVANGGFWRAYNDDQATPKFAISDAIDAAIKV